MSHQRYFQNGDPCAGPAYAPISRRDQQDMDDQANINCATTMLSTGIASLFKLVGQELDKGSIDIDRADLDGLMEEIEFLVDDRIGLPDDQEAA